MKIVSGIIMVFVAVIFTGVSGCSTFATLDLGDTAAMSNGHESARTSSFGKLHGGGCKDISEFNSLPYVYSGSKKAILNLTQPLHCGLDSGELSLINNCIYCLLYPLMLIDLPLSFVADTLALPYTIPKQYQEGDIIDPPYLRIANEYARRKETYRDKRIPSNPYYEDVDEDEIAELYEKGIKTLPKYYGDMSYADMDRHLGIGGELDQAVLWLAQYYLKKGNLEKSNFYSEKHIEIDNKRHSRTLKPDIKPK